MTETELMIRFCDSYPQILIGAYHDISIIFWSLPDQAGNNYIFFYLTQRIPTLSDKGKFLLIASHHGCTKFRFGDIADFFYSR